MFLGIFGDINLPSALSGYGEFNTPSGGLVGLINNLYKLVTIAAGLFSIVNFILAGYGIMTSSGDPEKLSKAQNKIWFSIVGLIIIVAVFTFAALLGWIIFKDTTAILMPKVYGP